MKNKTVFYLGKYQPHKKFQIILPYYGVKMIVKLKIKRNSYRHCYIINKQVLNKYNENFSYINNKNIHVSAILKKVINLKSSILIVWCLTKFMLTTNRHFDTGIILGKMHCSRNFIIIGVVLK